jgi:PII-like signaling protein
MNHECLRVFVHEGMRQEGRAIHDWLFDQARAVGIGGGSAFRASAGYGRHGLHEDRFFELAGDLPMSVEFIAESAMIDALLGRLAAAGLRLMYLRHPVTLAYTG